MKVERLLAICLMLFTVSSATIGAVTYFAKASDHAELRADFDFDKKIRERSSLQDTIWGLEAAYPNGMPEDVKKVYENLKKDLQRLIDEIEREKATG